MFNSLVSRKSFQFDRTFIKLTEKKESLKFPEET